jgi:polyphosphate kinase
VVGLKTHAKISLVGRYLEHSRVFRFGRRSTGYDHYIGSADLMPRNLDRRVEAATPVLDPSLKRRLDQMFRVELEDDVLAWRLRSDGTWTKVPDRKGLDAQTRLQELALLRAARPR